jgi:hypothetical protein
LFLSSKKKVVFDDDDDDDDEVKNYSRSRKLFSLEILNLKKKNVFHPALKKKKNK